MHQFLHLRPGFSVLGHLNGCAVVPVHVPVFQAMDLAVLVHVCAELVAGPAPAELPTPIPFNLVVECMRFNVIKPEPFKLWIFQILLPLLPLVFY